MNNLTFVAFRHAYGWTHWQAHMTVSAIIHALIYGLVFRLMRHMTLGEAAAIVVVVLGCLFLWARARDRRGW